MAEDPWAAFRVAQPTGADDPWAEFRGASPSDAPLQGRPFVPRPETQGRENNLLEIGKDVGRVALGGLTTGAMVVPDMANMARSAVNAGLDKIMPPNAAQVAAKEAAPKPIGSKEALAAVESATGIDTRPEAAKTEVGKSVAPYVKTASEFVPLAVGTGGGAIAGGVVPGLASEAFGQLTKGKWYEPIARIAGGVTAAPIAARAITPLPASSSRQRLVDILADEGVTSLTAGQKTGSEALKYAESALGNALGAGGKANSITRQGQEQFTEAATRRAGYSGDAGPEALAANNTRLGQQFEDVAARNNLQMDQRFAQDVGSAVQSYQRVPPSQQRAIVEGYVNDIIQHAQQGGQMPGPFYQEMRSRLSRQANSLRDSDPTLSETLRDLRNSLDSAFARSISADDQALLNASRREYGAQKVLEKSASRAGVDTAEGQIVPANLRNTVSAENRGAYARGQGDFSELARAGTGVMAQMPQSGTAPRAAMHALASILGGAAGSAGGMGVGSGIGAVAGAAAGPAILGRMLMSRPMQAYLANQAVPATAREQMVRALLEGGAAERQ